MAINVYIVSGITYKNMAFSNKSVEIDFDKIFTNLKSYFSNLSMNQEYAWLGIALGVLLVIVSIIIW